MGFITALVVGAIATAVLTTGSIAYNATDGFGLGNKVKSSLDIKKEQEAKKQADQAAQEVSGSVQNNGRYFVPKEENYATQPTRPTQATKPTQPTQATLPTVMTLPTLATGYRWQEYTPQQFQQRYQQAQQSQLFVDRYDTYANNGVISVLSNTFGKNATSFVKGAGVPRWALALMTLGFSEAYATTASLIDSYIWDINGDGRDSMIKNIFVDPWIEVANGNANVGQALLGTFLNGLNGMTEVFDILANPIKGIANNGWQGFLDSFGLGGNGYVVYDWQTGNFALDLFAEILSDPLNYIDMAKLAITGVKAIGKGVAKSATKTITKEVATETAKKVSKETIKKAMETVAKTSIKTGEVILDEGQMDKVANIVIKNAPKRINRARKAITYGAVEYANEAKTIWKATDGVQAKLYEGLLTDTLTDIRKAGIDVAQNPSIAIQVNAAVNELYKNIDLAKMTGQIMATDGVISTQKFLDKLDNISWLNQAYKDFNEFQGYLGKAALYGTAPMLPLFGLAVKNTKLAKALARGTNGLFSLLIAKLTNNTAEQFMRAITKSVGEFTPEAYSILRNAYIGASDIVHETLLDSVKVGSKQAIKENLTAPQIGAQAFQRRYAQKFSSDTSFYRGLIKSGKSEAEINNAWESYLKRNYNKTSREYIQYLNKINQIEKDATGIGLYSTYINRVKYFDRLRENARLRAFFKDPNNFVKINSITLEQGRHLNYEDLMRIDSKNIDVYANLEEYNKRNTTLAGEQAFIQTNNKVIIEADLYKELAPLYSEFVESGGTKGLLADIKKMYNGRYEYYINNLVSQLDYAERTYMQLMMFVEDVRLYAVLPDGIPEKALSTALMDAFMGLNSKVSRIDGADNIAKELAAIAELQLGQRFGEKAGFVKGLLTNDADFIRNLSISMEGYLDTLPDFGPVIFEYSEAANALKQLKHRIAGHEDLIKDVEAKYSGYIAEANSKYDGYIAEANKKYDRYIAESVKKREGIINSIEEHYKPKYEYNTKQYKKYLEELEAKFTKGTEAYEQELAIIEDWYKRANLSVDTKKQNALNKLKDIQGTINKHNTNRANEIAKIEVARENELAKHYHNREQALIKIEEAYPDALDGKYANEIQQIQELVDTINHTTARASDMVIVIKTEAVRAGIDRTFTSSIHDALAKAAGDSFAGTLVKITDGYNIEQFFSGVPIQDIFNIATVHNAQEIANKAMNTYNKVYLRIADEETTKRINAAWDRVLELAHTDVLFTGSETEKASRYFQELVSILDKTKDLDPTKKYSLIHYFYMLNESVSPEIDALRILTNQALDVEAYLGFKSELKNLRFRTNAPNFNGSGLDWVRANNLFATPINQQTMSDLMILHIERDKVARSLESLEMQIKNISNVDPLVLQNITQNRKILDMYNNKLRHYQDMVNDAIDKGAISRNLSLARTDEAARWITEEDLNTLDEIYGGTIDIPTEKITALNKHVDEYNRGCLWFAQPVETKLWNKVTYKKQFIEDVWSWLQTGEMNPNAKILLDDFSIGVNFDNLAVYPDQALKNELLWAYNHKNNSKLELDVFFKRSAPKDFEEYYKEIYQKYHNLNLDRYKELAKLYSQETFTEKDWDNWLALFNPMVKKNLKFNPEDYIPNAIKKRYVEALARNREYSLKIDLINSDTAVNHRRARVISIGSDLAKENDRLVGALTHEALHARFTLANPEVRARTIDTFWNHLSKGKNKDALEQIYQATWYRYKAEPSKAYMFDSDIYSLGNRYIQEEVMANILAYGDNPKLLNQIFESYAEYAIKAKVPMDGIPVFDFKDADTQKAIKAYYEEVMDDAFVNGISMDQAIVYYHTGEPIDLEAPFAKVDDIMKDFKRVDNQRTVSMMQTRLMQEPLALAQDLARTGPFQFYSITDIKKAHGDYSLYKYFDKEFKIRPQEYAKLQELGVGIEVLPEYDTIIFYIDKSRVGFDRNHSYLNGKLIAYDYQEFLHKGGKYDILENTSYSFNDAAYAITGQATGYSDGWRADGSFLTSLFKGTKDQTNPNFPSWPGFENLKLKLGGWELQDLLQPAYYPTMRFNEMLMGGSTFKRRFGSYQSANPMINMSNALQQMHTLNKNKTELLMMLFDDTMSLATGIWKTYSDEDLFNTYQAHPEMVLVTMTGKTKNGELTDQATSKFTKFWLGDSWNPVRVQEFIPFDVKDIARAREMGARFVPRSYFNKMYNVLNDRIGSDGVLKWFNRYTYIYKALALTTNPMTFVRNAIDTYSKGTIELGPDAPKWVAQAWKVKNAYQDINRIFKQHGIVGDKAIREFFDSGAVKAYTKLDFTYEMYRDIYNYTKWGPSTDGLATFIREGSGNPTVAKAGADLDDITRQALELNDDELMRIAARDVVPGYKGAWEAYTDFNEKIFNWENTFFGADAEKINRLAMYLKATAEGKTREQAFQWITKTHFDYSVRTVAEQALETVFPFITFTLKNLEYWLEVIATEPWVTKYLMDYFQTSFTYYDFTPEEMAASKQWQSFILSGNIPLNERPDDVTEYFKLSPSIADAFKTFINPLEVFKERMIFPTRAIEKSFTEDYKGQSLMGKQPIWNQVMDWTSSIPGNAFTRRITNAIKRDDTLSTTTELLGATGQMRIKPYTYGGGYTQRMKFVYNKDFTQRQLRSYSYRIPNYNSSTYNRVMHSYNRSKIASYKQAFTTKLGKAVLDPYKPLGQKLMNSLYIKKYPLATNTVAMPAVNRTQKRILSMTQYKVQRGLFSR